MRKDYDWSNYNKRYRKKMERKVFENFKRDLFNSLPLRKEELQLTDTHIVKLMEFIIEFEKESVEEERAND